MIALVAVAVTLFGVRVLSGQAEEEPAALILPLVSTLILCEHLDRTWRRDGMGLALKRLAGALVVVGVCYPLPGWLVVGALVLRAPETVLLAGATAILVNRFSPRRPQSADPAGQPALPSSSGRV